MEGAVSYVISALLSLLAFLGTSLWWGQRDLASKMAENTIALGLLAQRLGYFVDGHREWKESVEKRLGALEERLEEFRTRLDRGGVTP